MKTHCPKCGAEVSVPEKDFLGNLSLDEKYECGSESNAFPYGNFHQSSKCKDKQISQLEAEVAILEDVIDRLVEDKAAIHKEE